MTYNPERTIEALAKRQRRLPLTRKEVGATVAIQLGRPAPYDEAYIRRIEASAMQKIQTAIEYALFGFGVVSMVEYQHQRRRKSGQPHGGSNAK